MPRPRTKNRIDIDQFVMLWEADTHTDLMQEILGVHRERLMQLARKMGLRKRGAETLRPPATGPVHDPTEEEIAEMAAALREKWTDSEERSRRGANEPYEFPRVAGFSP
jgi:hypothetical protein